MGTDQRITISEHFAETERRHKAGEKPAKRCRDTFPIYEDDPWITQHELLNSYFSQTARVQWPRTIDPEKYPAGQAMLKAAPEEKTRLLRALIVRFKYLDERQKELDKLDSWEREGVIGDPLRLSTLLFRQSPPFTLDDLETLAEMATDQNFADQYFLCPTGAILKAVEDFARRYELSPALQGHLQLWRDATRKRNRPHKAERAGLERLNVLLGESNTFKSPIESGEAWSNAALAALKNVPEAKREQWNTLLAHCQTATASKPSQKWLKQADELLDALDRDSVKAMLLPWFELVALPRPSGSDSPPPSWKPDPAQLISDKNATVLRGLVWCCIGWKDNEVSRSLAALAETCFKKIRNLGPRCPRVGNACLYSLSTTASDDAAAQLSCLDQKVKAHSAKKQIGKSLDQAAKLSGQTREDLEESSVPTYGLDAHGTLRRQFGEFTAELRITGSDSTTLRWLNAAGDLQKSVPASVKQNHDEDFKGFKRTVQDIQKMLPAQKVRLERLLMTGRELPFSKWRERYLDHPLPAHLTRRLVWQFALQNRVGLGIWHDGDLVDVKSKALNWLTPDTVVRLWHPINSDLASVLAWRNWLENHGATQPFKQAHRELYLLTEAEKATRDHSNRFATHILRQHQFAALAKARGWRYSLLGTFDSDAVPTLEIPHAGLTAQFFVEGAPTIPPAPPSSGVFPHVSTSELRFVRIGGDYDRKGLPLAGIPAVIFSEVMRDADLFVGVCTIGNEPAWQADEAYWRNYSFGPLSETSVTRKEVLERLIPRLRIASQCSLTDKFLIVKGTLHTYKIHLRSSNILMSPNDQYLCIVPDRNPDFAPVNAGVALPFEDDHLLSVILSKAFLLAADDRITDPDIVKQIRP